MALPKRQPQLAIRLRPPGQWRALLKWLPAGPYRRSTLLFFKSSQTVRCAFKALSAESIPFLEGNYRSNGKFLL